jgi:phosphoglycolate phosphatase
LINFNHKLVIFDLDGTLMNTSPGIFATANKTMKELGQPIETDLKQLAKFVGPPLKDCFRLTYNLDEDLIDDACEIFRKSYEEHGQYLSTIYDGMEDLLQTLTENGVDCAVGTLKYELVARNMIKDKGLDKYFKRVYGTDPRSELTKASICERIVKELGHNKKDSVLIGDTMGDFGGAKQANIDFIAVTYGFGFNNESIQTDDMFSICSDTKQILNSLMKLI